MPDVKKRPDSYYYTRQGEDFVRWRALCAHLKDRESSAHQDEFLSKVLKGIENSTALHITTLFNIAYEQAKMTSFEMSFDRLPDLGPSLISVPGKQFTKRLTVPRCLNKEQTLTRKFEWLGRLAYAKGIDRSPTHDLTARTEMRQYDDSAIVFLLRAWEQGWDNAYDYVQELRLERQSLLDAPKVLSDRTIPRSPEHSAQRNMRPS